MNEIQTAIRDSVRRKYGEAALRVLDKNKGSSCCGGTSCCSDTITGDLYEANDIDSIPENALLASLGCGNPTALAQLQEGETVLDLGSGGGIDVLLSASRVGPRGFAFGLDMTDEMLELAERNRLEAGVENVRFLKGHIEDIPLPADSVDVIISNCVINLSADKDKVFKEAFRVLKPGGRFAVSDVIVEAELPDAVRRDMEAYVGCVAGALVGDDYLRRLAAAGFEHGTIEVTRRYSLSDLGSSCCDSAVLNELTQQERTAAEGKIMGAFIRAEKPLGP